MLTGMHVFGVDFESPRASRYTSKFQGDSSMSKVVIAAILSLVSLQSCFSAVYSGTITAVSLAPSFNGNTNFGSLSTPGFGGISDSYFGSGLDVQTTSPSGTYNNQKKIYKTQPDGGAWQETYGKGSVSDSVAWKDSVGLQFVARSDVTQNGGDDTPNGISTTGTYVESSGDFLFSISKDANYAIDFISHPNSGFVVGSSFIKLFNSSNVQVTSLTGVLNAGNYKVSFYTNAAPTGGSTGSDMMGFDLNFTELTPGPPVVPEPASLSVFGTLAVAGFAARRLRKK